MTARRRGLSAPLAALAGIFASPRVASACAVCFGGEETNWNGAFLAGTAVMLVLPPAILLGGGIVIYRAIKRQEALLGERERTSEPSAAESPARHVGAPASRARHLRSV